MTKTKPFRDVWLVGKGEMKRLWDSENKQYKAKTDGTHSSVLLRFGIVMFLFGFGGIDNIIRNKHDVKF